MNPTWDAARFLNRPALAAQRLCVPPTGVICGAGTSNFSPSAALRRGISSCSLNQSLLLEGIFRSSATRLPCCRWRSNVRLESDLNCRRTSSCASRNIRWIGSDDTANPSAPPTSTPMDLTVFMPLWVCAGRSADTEPHPPRRSIRPDFCQLSQGGLILFRPALRQGLRADSANQVRAPSGDFLANPVRLSRIAPGKSCYRVWLRAPCGLLFQSS